LGLFYCAAPLSGAFGGLLATGLAQINHRGYNSWPWIFIVEGLITVCFGILTIFFLPHTPATSSFLTEEERLGALRRLKLDAHGATAATDVAQEEFSWKWVELSLEYWYRSKLTNVQVRMALLNINTIMMSLTFFAIITPYVNGLCHQRPPALIS